MTKAVFMRKRGQTVFDDVPWERYHFPKMYLAEAEQTVGDWIVYYETSRNRGRKSYFAIAYVRSIDDDPNKANHYYARLSDYVEFSSLVPFRAPDDSLYEPHLLKPDGKTIDDQSMRSAVRLVPEEQFDAIVRVGFGGVLGAADDDDASASRPLIERVVSRPMRDRAFARAVKDAYGNACAVTGLKIINGGGVAEAQAAHIQPVAKGGPDSLFNGIALSATIHWMFDRGLISLEDDGKLLAAESLIPQQIERWLPDDRRLRLPEDPTRRPHPYFLAYHRDNVFKG